MAAKSTHRIIGKLPSGIGIGIAVCLVCTVVMAAIGASLLSSERIGEENAGYITVISIFLSSICGSLVAIWVTNEKRMPVCIAVGAGYFLSLLAMTALFFGGAYGGVGESGAVILAGTLSVVLLGLKSNNMHKKRRRK